VRRVDVEFDREAFLRPVDVQLEASLHVVHGGPWKTSGQDRLEEAPLEA